MTEHDLPSNEEAERYFERAKIMLDSHLVSREEATGSALDNAKKAFELQPENPHYFNLFLQTSLATRQSVFQLSSQEILEKAFQVPKCQEAVLFVINHVRNQLMDLMASDPESFKKVSFVPEMELLEKFKNIHPKPEILHALYFLYKLSGRQHEGMIFFKQAAEAQPENYGHHYIMACKNQERYQELIEYYEKNEVILQPVMSEVHLTVVAVAYEKRAAGLDWQIRIHFKNKGMPATSLEDYRKARAIYEKIASSYQPILSGGQSVSPDGALAIINHAQSFFQEAQCLAFLSDDQEDRNDEVFELKKTAFDILNRIIERMGEIDYPKSSDMYEYLLLAKTHLLSASANARFGIEAIEKAIGIAHELADDERFRDLGFENILLDNLQILLSIRGGLLKEEPVDTSERELLLLGSLMKNWKQLEGYAKLIQFYLEIGQNKEAYRIEQFCAIVPFLEDLIKLDKFGRQDFISSALGLAEVPDSKNVTDYNAALKKVYDSLEATQIELTQHVQPLYEALEPCHQRYKDYLAKIAPEHAIIQSRIKNIYSIILKLLKEDHASIPEVTDLLAFRALTDTEEEVRELYEKVRLGMRKDKPMKEWITIDKPTKTNYRSMDITGYVQGDDVQLQVQIRPKAIEAEISAGLAHHGHYKRESGWELERKINKNPIKYMTLLYEIIGRLWHAYRFIRDSEIPHALHELLEIYQNPPLPHLPDQPSK
ncbi:hypothetical protein KKA33_02030 [Patescibacteria group bacterium]|nr:hypothetical protein [Patescibacteria group bacterium]